MTLTTTLEPEHLGHGTTVGFAFEISSTTKLIPAALVDAELRYPGNLGFAVSGLGLATCSPARLAALGPRTCPVNSRMGFGSAVAELKAEGAIISETVGITIFRGPTREGHLALLFFANGIKPVSAQIVFPGLLIPADAPFGGAVSFAVPLVPSWPEGPDLSIVNLTSTLGPEHLTYYRRSGGETVPYNPQGILLPKVCPRGGFRFGGVFHFIDGSQAVAKTTVPCPS